MITKDLIRDSIRDGSIRFGISPYTTGTICQIGETDSFDLGIYYKPGEETAKMEREAFLQDDCINAVFDGLEYFRQGDYYDKLRYNDCEEYLLTEYRKSHTGEHLLVKEDFYRKYQFKEIKARVSLSGLIADYRQLMFAAQNESWDDDDIQCANGHGISNAGCEQCGNCRYRESGDCNSEEGIIKLACGFVYNMGEHPFAKEGQLLEALSVDDTNKPIDVEDDGETTYKYSEIFDCLS